MPNKTLLREQVRWPFAARAVGEHGEEDALRVAGDTGVPY